ADKVSQPAAVSTSCATGPTSNGRPPATPSRPRMKRTARCGPYNRPRKSRALVRCPVARKCDLVNRCRSAGCSHLRQLSQKSDLSIDGVLDMADLLVA